MGERRDVDAVDDDVAISAAGVGIDEAEEGGDESALAAVTEKSVGIDLGLKRGLRAHACIPLRPHMAIFSPGLTVNETSLMVDSEPSLVNPYC